MSNAMSIAVLTVSDSRTVATDTSGQFLVDSLAEAGHHLGARELVEDNIYKIRAVVSNWIADEQIEVVLITGGTGFTQRDTTPEAIVPLLHQEIAGYGELFRALSYKEIGASTVQSRAVGGLVNNTLVFCMPGSTGACRTAWNGIIKDQLDIDNKPCNFAELLKTASYSHGATSE
ncbi:MAG: molybdenum cofactor biosynthesis protein B [Pseudomonadales bacterium]|jgi:molybdenum cofactor biosynthesis protein B|nr:molybdenum cofactor biosynthesis protein B [Pseudomonadales bacterium]MDP7359309.1 molybdenum cofactor biosynthesis protein B [Pseudomonadales bacterium]MDP7594719.1 molybdenum cofactor biosynthesis protein B [Pseudomonadales bacterium]HJN48968.1 molybdenum cofactor biosynthesis protein B [Pseudomonadales bacterium]|tara:strand:- start:420 stop:944 length:525 start_codon:yes stop_codon:yes gene_type:complete